MPTRDAAILRQLLNTAHSGLLIIDQSGKVLFAYPAAHQILGWRKKKTRYLFSPEEGKALAIDKVNVPLRVHPVYQALAKHRPLDNCQFTWKRKNGRLIQLSVNLNLVTQQNVLQGAIISLQDISVKIGEERWRKHLLRVAGHELRNPLASIMALTETLELLSRPEDNDRRQEYLNKMKFKIRSTSRLLNDFLDATRLSAGQLQFRDREQNLDTFVARTVEDFQLSHPTHWISIEGETRSQVRFDSIRMAQVLENLLSNAVKNSPTGTGITVLLQKNKNFASVAVADKGVGIPKSEIPKVFQMYYQVKNGQTQPQGMGLGLYLVQRILGHYKSRIKIESEEGKGTAVRFSLPVVG